jgi:hypothetical protein
MNTGTSSGGRCEICGEPRLPGTRFCGRCGTTFPASSHRVSGLPSRRAPHPRTDLLVIALAAVLAVLVSHLPVIETAIYPFKLFGTFVHEWCHALVAVVTGGRVAELQINPDLSGETWTAGGWTLFIFSAGYVGAAVAGALLLLIPTRHANRVLLSVGTISILMPILGGVLFGTNFTSTTWLWTAVFGGVTLLVGAKAPARAAGLFQQFVAVELCFTAIDSLRQLAWITLNSPSTHTDALNAQQAFALPAMFWTVLWFALAVAAIGLAGFRVVRRSLA